MKKIFLVTEFCHPDQMTTGYLIYKVFKHFKQIYGSQLSLIVKEDAKFGAIDPDAIIVKDLSLNKKKLIQRFFFELIISFRFFFKILKNVKRGDLIFTCTMPIFLLVVIYFAKKIIGFKWILLVHDVFPENLVAAKILKKRNIVYRVLKKIFDILYSSPEKLIVIGHDMKELIDHKIHKKRSIVIQNWIDENDIKIQPKNDNEILQKIGWQDKKLVFQFFGNIGRVQGIDNLIQALNKIETSLRPHILFIGDGAFSSELERSISYLADEKIKYIGALEHSKKSIGLNACDIAIVTLADGMLGLGVPSKAYYSMAANKPILAIMDENSEIAQMINKFNIGWVVQPNQPNQLAEKLVDICENYKQSSLSQPREVLIRNYSESSALKKIVEVVESIEV